MFMESLRQSKKKHRNLMLVVVLVLAVSLVGSFAIWQSPSGQGGSGSESDNTAQYQAALQSVQTAIDTKLAEVGEGNTPDFATASAIGELYATAYQYNSMLEDAQNAVIAANQAAVYYELALQQAPAELNEQGLANYKALTGTYYLVSNQFDKAGSYLKEALDVMPEDYQLNYSYAMYLMRMNKTDEAIAHLTSYRATLEDGGETAQQVDSLIALLNAMQNPPEQSTDESEGENTEAGE